MKAIETRDLSKQFKPVSLAFWRRENRRVIWALRKVTLEVEAGTVFGLLGPNGAGKSTLVKTLCTLLLPTEGTARVNGYDVRSESSRVRACVGLVSGDERSFYWRLSARENLLFFANLQGLHGRSAAARVDELLEFAGVAGKRNLPFRYYSTGMKQRIGIARGLLHDPAVVFFDEPTKGLDFEASRNLHAFIRGELVEKGNKTVFLTTHDMAEAEALCEAVAVLSQGRIKVSGTLPDLTRGSSLKKVYEAAAAE